MGPYLSKPVTIKTTITKEGKFLKFAASGMQGKIMINFI